MENNFNNYYVWLAPKGTDAGIVSYLASLCEDVANNNEKYAADQQAINFNDPFIVTGQDAIDLLAELQDVANENVKVLLILKDCVSPYLGHTSIKKRKNGLNSVLHRIQAVRAYCVGEFVRLYQHFRPAKHWYDVVYVFTLSEVKEAAHFSKMWNPI